MNIIVFLLVSNNVALFNRDLLNYDAILCIETCVNLIHRIKYAT
jgi:hypothetical protein